MKAIVYSKYGSPDVLEMKTIQKPVPTGNEVLVEVHAAAVNSGDWRLLHGTPFPLRFSTGLFRPKNQVLGADVAGIITAVGEKVTQFQPGDAVFGDLSNEHFGGYAEYVTAPETAFAQKPVNLTFEQSAAIPQTAGVAIRSLREKANLQMGQKVLIVGASGGIGTFAIQIAKAYRAEVTAVCSTKNIELVKSIGADHVIDYTQEDFAKSGQTWDVIIGIAGYHSLDDFKQSLTPQGVYVMVGGDMKQIMDATIKGKRFSEPGGRTLTFLSHTPKQQELILLKELVENGKVKPVIDRVFPFEKTGDALRYYGKGHSTGKVIIQIRSVE